MVFRTPYPRYFDLLPMVFLRRTHGMVNPLAMLYQTP
jgi:hypothetical protein